MTQADCFRNFVVSLTRISILIKLAFITTTFHIVNTYLVCTFIEPSIIGLGISRSLTDLFYLICIQYMINNDTVIKREWLSFDKESLKHFKEYFMLGIPSILMFSLEFWAFELMIVLSGWISVNDVAANIIALNV